MKYEMTLHDIRKACVSHLCLTWKNQLHASGETDLHIKIEKEKNLECVNINHHLYWKDTNNNDANDNDNKNKNSNNNDNDN